MISTGDREQFIFTLNFISITLRYPYGTSKVPLRKTSKIFGVTEPLVNYNPTVSALKIQMAFSGG
jgi:hypothetical protein